MTAGNKVLRGILILTQKTGSVTVNDKAVLAYNVRRNSLKSPFNGS